MSILYFIPRYDAAAMGNRIHSEVIDAWRERGVATEVITLDARVRRTTSANEQGIVVHRLPASAGLTTKLANRALGTLLHYPYLVGASIHLRSFLQRRRYSFMHIETAFPLGLIATLAAPPDLPLAVTLPGADVMAEPEFDYGYGRFATVQMLTPLVLRRAVVLRADSPHLRELAVRLGAPPAKVTAIPYNVTEDSYPAPGTDIARLRRASRAAVVAQHGLDLQRPIVVTLSRLHPFKGVAYLVEALPQIAAGGVQPQVLIVGPSRQTPRFGDYGAYLAQRASDLGVSDAVALTGSVPHDATLRYLAAADAVVVPSVAESFNRVAVEAAAVGTPVVVTRTTGVSAYIADAQCGLVVEPRSAAAVAEALLCLFSDDALWQRFSARALPFAEQFRSPVIAQALLDLYQEYGLRVRD